MVKAGLDFNDVTRTSDTVVTITFGAEATYNITATETITVTVPASALVQSASPVVATPTFQITTSAAPAAALTGTLADGATDQEIWLGDETLVITLTGDHWDDTVGDNNAFTQALIDGLDSDGVEALGWDLTVRVNLIHNWVTRTSDTVVTIALEKEYGYTITATETITVTVPASALKVSGSAVVATPTFDITLVPTRTFQTWNAQSDGSQDTVCSATTQFGSAQTIEMLEGTPSCGGTKEDKIKWTFGAPEGTNETDVLVTYFDNTGYLIDTIVTGQSTGNEIQFKAKNTDGTFRIKLVEVNPSTGAVISVLDTHTETALDNVTLTVTDLSDLTGTVGIGNTFGFQLTYQGDASGAAIETKFGSYGTALKQALWHIYEEPDLALLTAVDLISFAGTAYDRAVLVEWRTGYEIDNLGFNVYREVDGERVKLTSSLVAGSGLLAERGTAVTQEQAYAWWDNAATRDTPGLTYWLEDVDFDGTSTWHGPMTPAVGGHLIDVGPPYEDEGVRGDSSGELSGLADSHGVSRRAFFTDNEPTNVTRRRLPGVGTPLETQWGVASQSAVKIGVQRTGWFRVSQAALVAAGLDPTADPRSLRVFVDGVEQAITVSGEADGRFDPADAIGFFGQGVDTAYTDTRVYWVVTGAAHGLRIRQASPPFRAPGGRARRVKKTTKAASPVTKVEKSDKVEKSKKKSEPKAPQTPPAASASAPAVPAPVVYAPPVVLAPLPVTPGRGRCFPSTAVSTRRRRRPPSHRAASLRVSAGHRRPPTRSRPRSTWRAKRVCPRT